jgi:hypothetical protein
LRTATIPHDPKKNPPQIKSQSMSMSAFLQTAQMIYLELKQTAHQEGVKTWPGRATFPSSLGQIAKMALIEP